MKKRENIPACYFFFFRTSIKEPAAIPIAAPIPITIIVVGICAGCVVFGCGVLLVVCVGVGVASGVCVGCVVC